MPTAYFEKCEIISFSSVGLVGLETMTCASVAVLLDSNSTEIVSSLTDKHSTTTSRPATAGGI